MGNQREVRQVSPRSGLGVILLVRVGLATDAKRLVDTLEQQSCYMHFCPAREPIEIPNLDSTFDIRQSPSDRDHIAIQSGGKMWCGYENFIDHVRSLAPLLEDAQFFVGDEEDYIDEFSIVDGKLLYKRVHQGFWWGLAAFLSSRGVTPDA